MSATATLPLRLMPMSVSSAAHAAVIAALIVASPLPRPSLAVGETAIEVAMVDEGEIGAPKAEASIAPATEPQQADPPVADPPQQEATPTPPPAPAPEVALQEAPSPLIVSPPPVVAPKARIERPTQPKAVLPKTMPPRREAAPRAAPRREAKAAPAGAEGAQARNGTGAGQARAGAPGNAAAGAAYAGRVRAILQGRANALGIEDHEGAVGVSFTIGASGRMESHAITRTSGSGSVDRLIRGMLASASFPPPPGGRFVGSVTIRIQ